MGVEPTSIGLQPIAWPSGSSVSPKVFSPGIEPGLRPSQSRVRIQHTPRTSEKHPAEESNLARRLRRPSCIRHTRRAKCEYPDLDSNQGLDLRRVQCNPLHHRDMLFFKEPTTGFAPACFRLQGGRLSHSSHVGNQRPQPQHEREDSNPMRQFWRLTALPGARSCKRCSWDAS